MELSILKNKNNGQVSINIPKAISELYSIDENSKVTLELKDKKNSEFRLIVKNG